MNSPTAPAHPPDLGAAAAGWPTVTVAIPTYNRARWLRETLASLAAHTYSGGSFEVLVIDNRSTDTTAEIAQSFLPGRPTWRYLLETAQGANHARNRAVQEATGEILVLLDDDVLLQPGWLDALVEPWRRPSSAEHPIAAVGGEVIPIYPEGCPKWLERWATPLRLRPDPGPLTPRQMPMSANLAFHRSVFAEFGLFRTDLGRKGKNVFSGDESELLKRYHRAGREVWFAPSAVAQHQFPLTRLNLRYTCRHSFDSARSRVLEAVTTGSSLTERVGYCLSRFLANFLKGLFLSLGILFLWLTGQGDRARQATIRLTRCGGYLYETVASLPKAFAPPLSA